MDPFSAIGLGASALTGIITGISQRRQFRNLINSNIRPFYNQSSALQENRAIAQNLASTGLPSQVYNNNVNQIQQNFSTGLRMLGGRGVSPFNVNSLIRNNNQAYANLNAQDAQARLQGTQQLMNANTAIANDQRYAFNVNQLQPYQQTMALAQGLGRAGSQNIFNSLTALSQGAMMGVFGRGNSNSQLGAI